MGEFTEDITDYDHDEDRRSRMATVTLKFVNPAAAGKKFGSVVDTNGVRYPVGRGLVDKFTAGRTYEVTLEDQNWAGKPVTLITALDSVRTAPQTAQALAERQTGANSPQGASTGGSLGRLTEPELRFVSNVVGSAITAKTLTGPHEIGIWAKAAAAAVKEI